MLGAGATMNSNPEIELENFLLTLIHADDWNLLSFTLQKPKGIAEREIELEMKTQLELLVVHLHGP